jgi:hypothetical protein
MLPLSQREEILSQYCTYLSIVGANRDGRGNSYETILGKLHAVKWAHKLFRGVEMTTGPSLKMVLDAIRRESKCPKGKLPVSLNLLRALHEDLKPSHLKSSDHARVLWGVILLAFFFMARRSEVALQDKGQWGHSVLRKDIWIVNATGRRTVDPLDAYRVFVRFRSSKTDQRSAGAVRSLGKSGDSVLCPVKGALWALLSGIHNQDSPIATSCIPPVGFRDIAAAVKIG